MRSRSRPAVAVVTGAVAAWPFSILAFAVVVTQFTMLSIPAILMSAPEHCEWGTPGITPRLAGWDGRPLIGIGHRTPGVREPDLT